MISRYGQSMNVRDEASSFWMKGIGFSFAWVRVGGYIGSCGTRLSLFIYYQIASNLAIFRKCISLYIASGIHTFPLVNSRRSFT